MVQDRRSQVRRAQRTYRLKKEATVQSLNTRVADLEGSLRTISDILVNFQDAVVRSDLNLSTPDLSPSSSDAVDRILAELDKTGLWPDRRDVRPESFARPGVVTHEPFFKPINYIERGLLDVFGYQVSHQSDETWQVKDEAQHQRRQDHLSPRHVPRLFPSFSGDPELRRLFEHAHQADSRFVACLLGLLRCLPDENASTANSVDAGSQYQIGDLKATLQSVMESTLGLGDLEKQPGYDQRWVHCRDVRAYLERMGIMLDRSSVLVDIPLQAAIAIQEDSQTGSEGERERDDRVDSGNQNNSRNESTAPDTTGPSDYFLDVECFFNRGCFLGCQTKANRGSTPHQHQLPQLRTGIQESRHQRSSWIRHAQAAMTVRRQLSNDLRACLL